MDNLIGLIIVLVSAGLIAIFTLLRRKIPGSDLRTIPAIQRLRRAVGLAVEDGKRLHVSLGRSNILSPTNASAFVGLASLERLAQLSRISDRPPLATSGDGVLSLLSQDTLRGAYRLGNSLEQYDPDRGRFSGPTPFSYIAGAMPVIAREQVSTTLLIGNFGPEAALFCDLAAQNQSFTLAASDSLPAQAVLYATAQEPLIGEEIFAVPAYLKAGAAQSASLRVQDILRWGLIAFLLFAFIIKLIEVLLGVKLL